MELQQVRRIRARYGDTVNDVLLSVMTGALWEWLRAWGDSIDGLSLRPPGCVWLAEAIQPAMEALGSLVE